MNKDFKCKLTFHVPVAVAGKICTLLSTIMDQADLAGEQANPGEIEEIEEESGNPFAIPQTNVQDSPVEPMHTRLAIGRWCSACLKFFEDPTAIVGSVESFVCPDPDCGEETHPTVTTKTVPA